MVEQLGVMSTDSLQLVLKALPDLTVEEIRSIRLRLDFLRKHTQKLKEGTEQQDNQQFCFEIFRNCLLEAGLPCPPWGAFQRLGISRYFQQQYPIIETYIETQFVGTNRRERQKLYRIFAELLLDWMNEKSLMKIGVFFKNVNLIPELLSKAFPGYAAQGWLPLILTMGDRNAGT